MSDLTIATRYGIAVVVCVLAVLLRLSLDPLWGTALPLITFFPAIMASAWLGGLGPGLVTTLLAAVAANYFWMQPRHMPYVAGAPDAAALAMFVLIGVFIAGVTEALRRARRRQAAALEREQTARVAIAASEERLGVTLASIGDAVIATDADGRVTLMNAVAQALTGWSVSDAIGRPLAEVFTIVDEQSRQAVERPTDRVLREGKITGLANHTVLVSKDGHEIPIDDSAAPIRDADGRMLGAVLVFRDISQRRQVERERAALLDRERAARSQAEGLSARLRSLQSVTDTTLSARSVVDLLPELLARARAAMASDTATILLLADGGAHLTPIYSDGLHEELAVNVRIPLGRGVAGQIALSERGMIIHDLSTVEVVSPMLGDRVKSLVGAPLKVGGRLLGVIHVGASQLQRFTQDDLSFLRLVADRAALAIERARLDEAEQAAREEAETANRAKDDFLAMLSHELRTPLNTVLGWTRMLRSRPLDGATVTRALEVIERNARAQTRLIEDLLDVSSIVSGKLRLDPMPVNPAAIVKAALEEAQWSAEAKGIRLDAELDPAETPIVADAGRLRQVVSNLLSNAIKFTPAGGRVAIRLERPGSHVRITVTDTGRGISADFLPHVFDRFRQTQPAPQGSLGLGLAIVRHIVELHHGTMQATSAGEGKGATFVVTLAHSTET